MKRGKCPYCGRPIPGYWPLCHEHWEALPYAIRKPIIDAKHPAGGKHPKESPRLRKAIKAALDYLMEHGVK